MDAGNSCRGKISSSSYRGRSVHLGQPRRKEVRNDVHWDQNFAEAEPHLQEQEEGREEEIGRDRLLVIPPDIEKKMPLCEEFVSFSLH